MKIFNRGNISYFIAPIIILILMYAVFTFTLVLNKANAAQNIKINSDFELFDQNNKKIKKFNLLDRQQFYSLVLHTVLMFAQLHYNRFRC